MERSPAGLTARRYGLGVKWQFCSFPQQSLGCKFSLLPGNPTIPGQQRLVLSVQGYNRTCPLVKSEQIHFTLSAVFKGPVSARSCAKIIKMKLVWFLKRIAVAVTLVMILHSLVNTYIKLLHKCGRDQNLLVFWPCFSMTYWQFNSPYGLWQAKLMQSRAFILSSKAKTSFPTVKQ